MTENKVGEADLATIDKVVNRLAPRYHFGCYTVADMKQEATLIALKALAKYDASRGPLENFLYRTVRNRLNNFVRDHCYRNDPPCKSCHQSINGETRHENGKYCKPYRIWRQANITKLHIRNPVDIDAVSQEHETGLASAAGVLDTVELRDILALIDRRLPVELRSTYLQMRDGHHVPKAKRQLVEAAIKEICFTNEETQI